jgi:hypothetical protein
VSPWVGNAVGQATVVTIVAPQDPAGGPASTLVVDILNSDGVLLFAEESNVQSGTLNGKLQTANLPGGPFVDVVGGAFTPKTAASLQMLKIPRDRVRKWVKYLDAGDSQGGVAVQVIFVPRVTG